ncbi:Predicted anti-sigma-YlaC factor YlaD, contains Zn-finger domain [Amycolatopsis saalfeldensis]|uniref:Predicted anti-sigma-YlaC factor YlaD, contains Zn-finger domain n=1 Tax=Amycolatopsis saalfeldensis TaxID=394193 RepID=A0A1H8YLP2_9PSEU|nr:Predicted anti-sigma-YlaC factor YlaD, contains Zn-finger domain [Amycolatopsis saalfeldensis]
MHEGRGNSGGRPGDYVVVSCEIFREALSARLDSEPGPLPADQVDAHLATCSACRGWYARGEALRRAMLVRSAPAVPDLTASILAQAPPVSREKWGLRVALGLVGLVQCGLAFAQLLGMDTGVHGGPGGAAMAGHLINESAAWNLAVGIGLLWAALRTRAAAGQLPMIAGFVLVLTVVTTSDLIGGQVTAGRVLTHVFLVVGLGLLFAVHRQHRARQEPGPGLGDELGTGTETRVPDRGTLGPARPATRRGRNQQRPAGRHHAA